MKYKRSISHPTLLILNNIVMEVNRAFENLTGYNKKELIGKTVYEINNLLMVDLYSLLNNDDKNDCYIFTKKLEPREVIVNYIIKDSNEITFSFKEKINSRIENRLSYLMSLMKDTEMGIAIYSVTNLIILKANQKYIDEVFLITNNSNKIIGRSLRDIFIGFNGSNFEKLICNTIKTGEKFKAEEVKFNFGKSDIYYNFTLTPIFINDNIKYIVQRFENVTEQVVMRNILVEQKYELESIIENMSDELIIFTESGKYIKLNKAAKTNFILNYKVSKNLKEFEEKNTFYDKDGNIIPKDRLPFKRIINGERIKDFRIDYYSDNEILRYELKGIPIYDNFGNFISGVIVLHDIREKLINDENLYIKAHYDSLRSIVENLDLGFSRLTYPELNYIDINYKTYNLLSKLSPEICSYESIIGHSLLDIHKSSKKLIELIDNSIKNNTKVFSKIINYQIDGKEIYLKYIFQPLFGLDNNIIELIITWLDVTEEINSKIDMEKSLKIQDEIYSNISHELKTPLNVIYSANQMMDIYLNKPLGENMDKILHYNKSIKQNCFRLIKLINNIVDLSKINSGFLKYEPSNVNIVELIENIVDSISDFVEVKQLHILFDTNVEEKIIACDIEKIERIMLNLISNAIKFTSPGNYIY